MTKITFKRDDRATGLARVCDAPGVTLKIKGKQVGRITNPMQRGSAQDGWAIRLMIKCEEHPGWKWVGLRGRFNTETEARAWVMRYTDVIVARYDLHHND